MADRLLWALCLAVPLAVLIQGSLIAGVSSPLYDDSYNASVAKNLARGLGYATSYDRLVPFNQEITTGPVLIIPLAGLIAYFGNLHFLPGLTVWLVNLLLLTGIVVRVCAMWRMPRDSAVGAACLFAVLLVLLTDEAVRHSGEYAYFRGWVKFLGEMPSALLILLGSLVLFSGSGTAAAFAGGLCLGLSYLTKQIAVLSILPQCAVYAWYLRARWLSAQERPNPAPAAAGCILPWACYRLYQVMALTPQERDDLVSAAEQFFVHRGSGLDLLAKAVDAGWREGAELVLGGVTGNAVSSAGILYSHLGGIAGAAIVLGLFWCSIQGALGESELNRRCVFYAVAASAFAHQLWWTLLSQTHWIRHDLHVWIYLSFLGSLGFLRLAEWARGRVRPEGVSLALAVSLVVAVGSAHGLYRPFLQGWWLEDPRTQALLTTSRWIDAHPSQDGSVYCGVGWWANRDLEYVLPSVLTFNDCWRRDVVSSELALGDSRILVRSEYWNWERDPAIAAMAARCDRHVLFESPPFRVSQCPGLEPLHPLERSKRARAF